MEFKHQLLNVLWKGGGGGRGDRVVWAVLCKILCTLLKNFLRLQPGINTQLAKRDCAPADVNVNLCLSSLKLLHANWQVHAPDNLQGQPNQLLMGWEQTGIADAVAKAFKASQWNYGHYK